MVTPLGFSVCHTSITVSPGLIDAGSARKPRILAGASRASVRASAPAGTAPGARGVGCEPCGCAGACAHTAPDAAIQITATATTALMDTTFPLRFQEPAVRQLHGRRNH